MTLKTGDEFVENLKDSREVYYQGERIDDVTTHPATRGLIESHADLFDMQHSPDHRDTFAVESPETDEPISVFYRKPRSAEDLEQIHRASKLWADRTCGMVPRTHDFLALAVTGMAIGHENFTTPERDYGRHVLDYHKYCRDNDITLTHSLRDPQIDRSSDASEELFDDEADRPGTLRKVEETAEGIVVSGARMLATMGPQVDELLVYPARGRYAEGEEDIALTFAVPLETDGLRMVCRPSVAMNDARNYPLGTRFEDQDTFVIFDRVLVPWDRVFINGDIEIMNDWRGSATAFANLSYLQIALTHLAKVEFAMGVALLLTESTGIDEYWHVKKKLGEIANGIETIRACVTAMKADATGFADTGYVVPETKPGFVVADGLFPDLYPRIVDIIRDLAGSGAIAVPTWEDYEAENPLGNDIKAYFEGKDVDANERIAIQKLAFELVVSGMGGREELYERFSSGGPMRGYIKLLTKLEDKEEMKQNALDYAYQGPIPHAEERE